MCIIVKENEIRYKTEEKRGETPKKKKLHFKWFLYLILVFVVCSATGFRFQKSFRERMQKEYDELCISAHSFDAFDEKSLNFQDIHENVNTKSIRVRLQLAAYDPEWETDPQILLDRLNENADKSTVFYYYSSGKVLYSPGKRPLSLDDDEIKELLFRGKLSTEEEAYFAKSCADGNLILSIPLNDEDWNLMMIWMANTSLTYDTDTGEIQAVYDTDASTEIMSSVENIHDLHMIDMNTDWLTTDSDITFYIASIEKSGFAKWQNAFLFVKIADEDESEYYYYDCFFSSVAAMIKETIFDILVPIFLMLVFTLVSILTSQKLKQLLAEYPAFGKEMKLGKKLRLNFSFVGRHLFIQFSMTILILSVAIFVQTLSIFSELYVEGEEHIESLSETISSNEEIQELLLDEYTNEMQDIIDFCADEIGKYPEADVIGFLEQVASAVAAKEISVYDKNGKIEYSTSGYIGYPLGETEESDDLKLWSLINGGVRALSFEMQEEEGLYCFAVSRTDAVGLVKMVISDNTIHSLKKELSFENAIASADFQNSNKLYTYRTNPESQFIIMPKANKAKETNSLLPVLEYNEYCAMLSKLEGTFYFIFGQGFKDVVVYSASPISSVVSEVISAILFLGFCCLLVSLLVIIDSALYLRNQPEAEESASPMDTSIPEFTAALGKKLYLCWISTFLGVLFILVFERIFRKNSVLSFLLNKNWKQGFNIFAVGCVVFALVFIIFLHTLVKWFLTTLSKSLTPRSVTICHLIGSVMNVLFALGLILYALEKFGIDTTTIVAGAGVSTLVLGIGAKDAITDLIAGIFIILDGHVRIGDYVEVSGFDGFVVQVGMRTTKIRLYGKEISVNNSSMKNVVNYSKGDMGILLDFAVSRNTNLDHLASVINNNLDRLEAACDSKLKRKIRYLGIVGFTVRGPKCRILALANLEDSWAVSAILHNELAFILKENDIIFYNS